MCVCVCVRVCVCVTPGKIIELVNLQELYLSFLLSTN